MAHKTQLLAISQHKLDFKAHRFSVITASVVMETRKQIFGDEFKPKDDQPRPKSVTPGINPTYRALIG